LSSVSLSASILDLEEGYLQTEEKGPHPRSEWITQGAFEKLNPGNPCSNLKARRGQNILLFVSRAQDEAFWQRRKKYDSILKSTDKDEKLQE
jgi:hypothetical protein